MTVLHSFNSVHVWVALQTSISNHFTKTLRRVIYRETGAIYDSSTWQSLCPSHTLLSVCICDRYLSVKCTQHKIDFLWAAFCFCLAGDGAQVLMKVSQLFYQQCMHPGPEIIFLFYMNFIFSVIIMCDEGVHCHHTPMEVRQRTAVESALSVHLYWAQGLNSGRQVCRASTLSHLTGLLSNSLNWCV